MSIDESTRAPGPINAPSAELPVPAQPTPAQIQIIELLTQQLAEQKRTNEILNQVYDGNGRIMVQAT